MKHDLVLSLRDLAILATGLVVGGQLLILVAVIPALRQLSPLEGLRFHQAAFSVDLPDSYIQPAGVLSILLGVALLALGPGSTADICLTAAGIAAVVAIAAITRTVNRPINRLTGTWSDDQADEYPAVRERWRQAHAARTVCGFVAFVSYIVLASH